MFNPDNTSRIISIWDQTIQNGPAPEHFTFGTEYRTDIINKALSSAKPHSIVLATDSTGHGTSVASIIAGSPNDVFDFTGVAPKTELVVVKLKEAKRNIKKVFCVPDNTACYMESDIMLGVRYVYSVSKALHRPIVICLALGSSQGGHDRPHLLYCSPCSYLKPYPQNWCMYG